jgi:nitrogen regulatory protein PII
MDIKKVVAFIRSSSLTEVEESLRELGVKGFSVFQIKGHGAYPNLSKPSGMAASLKIEIFAAQSRVEAIVDTILNVAHLGIPGDGMVAVLPVEKLYRIRTRAEAGPEEL